MSKKFGNSKKIFAIHNDSGVLEKKLHLKIILLAIFAQRQIQCVE